MFSAFTYGFVDELVKTGASAPKGGLNSIISKVKGLGTMLGKRVKRLGRKTKAGAKAGARAGTRAFAKQGQEAPGSPQKQRDMRGFGNLMGTLKSPATDLKPNLPGASAGPPKPPPTLDSVNKSLKQTGGMINKIDNRIAAMKKQGAVGGDGYVGVTPPGKPPRPPFQGPGNQPPVNVPIRPGQQPRPQNPTLPGPGGPTRGRPPAQRPPVQPPMRGPAMGTGCGIGKQGSLKQKLMMAGLLGSALYAGKKLKDGVEEGDITLPRHLTKRPVVDAGQ